MTNFKVAVLRARHDDSADLIPNAACRETIISNDNDSAVFQYWTHATLGEVTFTGSRMFPWVDIKIDGTDADERSRFNLYERARAATEGQGHDLGEFDIVFVVVHPPMTAGTNVDYGATSDGDTQVAVLRSTNSHALMCHELGHTLGWKHSYGVPNNGAGDLGRTYGDPFDVMSSATFGSRWRGSGPTYSGSPTFAVDPPPTTDWPEPWASAGPLPAQAHLDLRYPDLLSRHRRRVRASLPEMDRPGRAVLWAPERASDGQPTLLSIHPPNEAGDGHGRYYVEYRDTTGWDRGLETSGDDLARRGVVVHRLARVADAGVVCWYVGRVPVPLEADHDVGIAGLPLQVRVASVASDLSHVTLELARTAQQSVFIDRRDSNRIVDFTEQRVDTVDTLCGTLQARWGFRRVVTTSTFSVRSYGFGGTGSGTSAAPTASWTVGGQPVSAGTTSVRVSVPPGRSVTVTTSLNATGSELTCTNTPDQGEFETPVAVRVTDAAGASATSAPEPYRADGIREGYERSVQSQLQTCITEALNRLRIRPQEIFMRPFDGIDELDTDRLARTKIEAVLRRARLTNPALASELSHLVSLRYG